ncbi:MAG: S9 family peptidase [Burkholderiales bacterium]|nr:S9 family peptidase [Burkholderiales bacterium]
MKRFTCAAALALASVASIAQTLTYREPPEAIRAVLDARALPARTIDPTGKTLAIAEMRRYPSIEQLSRPFLRLAGMRIDPASNGPHRVAHVNRLVLRALEDSRAAEREVALPAEGDFYSFNFSPDGRRFTLLRRTSSATELWAGDVASARAAALPGIAVQNVDGFGIDWLDADTIVVRTVARRGAPPAATVPTGPVVQESFGRKSPEPTFQDLLRSPLDAALYEHYATSELTRVDLASGGLRRLAPAAIHAGISAVGDGRHLLVERIVKPFSYAVTHQGFGREILVIDREGRVVKELPRVALRENVPVQGVVQGPRTYSASVLRDGAVYWLEALDEGDPRKKVAHRDRLLKLAAPYDAAPVEVARFAQRVVNVQQLEDGRLFVTDFDRDRFWIRRVLVNPAQAGGDLHVVFDMSARDRYNDPGTALSRSTPQGRPVVIVNNGKALFAGAGASAAGDRPFLDRWDLAAKAKERLFQASETHYEQVVRVLDDTGTRFVTSRESAAEPPNLVLRDPGGARAITAFADPTPQVRAIRRELVRFKRKDGVDLSFWLYRPADQKPGERRPAFVWAYPLEYTDPALAGQVTGSPNRFEQFAGSTPLFLVLEGFVVLNDATMPVVGDPEKVNDTFIEQITMNAEAILAKASEIGVVDPARVAVGGHSYGAFMTAHLLAHTDIFKAGIARSGAYNRTLTPFGFQAERRTLWEAPGAYTRLSPFMVADKLKEPILLIHGEADDNTGTYPEQSDRMFAALAGTGGTVRFVKLPAEAHGYAARESVGHTLWEMSTWLRKHLGDPRSP